MGADIKNLRTRIKSVDSTLHLTKAMGLVASSKMRKANEAMQKSREYKDGLESVLASLTSSPECRKSPYMRCGGERTRLIVIAGDRGLAGGYNANVFRALKDYPDAQIIPIGKRACERYSVPIVSSEHFSISDAYEMATSLCKEYVNGKYDRLGIVCTRYVSIMTQEAYTNFVFPLTVPRIKIKSSTVFEPDELTVFDAVILEYVAGVIVACVRESFASEIAARRMAMDSAGKNAGQMIDELRLKYNRARQGTITQEITEIVAGSNV